MLKLATLPTGALHNTKRQRERERAGTATKINLQHCGTASSSSDLTFGFSSQIVLSPRSAAATATATASAFVVCCKLHKLSKDRRIFVQLSTAQPCLCVSVCVASGKLQVSSGKLKFTQVKKERRTSARQSSLRLLDNFHAHTFLRSMDNIWSNELHVWDQRVKQGRG